MSFKTAADLIASLRGRFGRVTSTGEIIQQADGLRCLALFLVMAHHVFASYLVHTHRLGAQQLPRDWAVIAPRSDLVMWALHLAIGVPLYCVISGFVLTIPFARAYLAGKAPPSRRVYLLRRLVRLEAPYVINLLFLFLVIVFPWHQQDPVGHFRDSFRVLFPHLVASLMYLHSAIFGGASWINGVAWTLEVEVQFYLLAPLLAQIFRIRKTEWRRVLLISLIVIGALTSQFLVEPSSYIRLRLSLANQIHYFLAGLLLTDLYLNPPLRWIGSRGADLLALASAALLVTVLHWAPRMSWTAPFLIAGFYIGVLRGAWAGRLFGFRILTILGGMSYTTYLYHSFIIDRLIPSTVRMFPPNNALWFDAAVQFLILLPPMLGAGAVLYILVERPFMILSRDVARRYRDALQPRPEAPSPTVP